MKRRACEQCDHTFGESDFSYLLITRNLYILDLFNDYDQFYHNLKHYKDKYKSEGVKKVVLSSQGMHNYSIPISQNLHKFLMLI